MLIVEGQRKNGNEFRWEYKDEDLKVAEFEFEITKVVANYIILARDLDGSYQQLDIYYKE